MYGLYHHHITVETNDIVKFKADCKMLKCKITIVGRPGSYEDVMTTQYYIGEYDEAVSNMELLAFYLSKKGYAVKRKKLEFLEVMEPCIYLETHIKTKININNFQEIKEKLEELCKGTRFHVAKNPKETNKDYVIQSVNGRTKINDVIHVVNMLNKILRITNVIELKVETCVYDSNAQHDGRFFGEE